MLYVLNIVFTKYKNLLAQYCFSKINTIFLLTRNDRGVDRHTGSSIPKSWHENCNRPYTCIFEMPVFPISKKSYLFTPSEVYSTYKSKLKHRKDRKLIHPK